MVARPKGQILLSESCQRLMDQLNKAAIEGDSEEIFSSIVAFITEINSYPEEAKNKQNINKIFEDIISLHENIVILRAEREKADGLDDSATMNRKTKKILKNYKGLKKQVESLLAKTKIVEKLKMLSNGTGWASPFLTKYYQAIAQSGSLQDLRDKLFMNAEEWDESRCKLNFRRLKSKLDLLSPVVKELNDMNRRFPEDLKEKLVAINTIINRLTTICINEKDMKNRERTNIIFDCHEKLKEEMKSLYERSIERSVSQ